MFYQNKKMYFQQVTEPTIYIDVPANTNYKRSLILYQEEMNHRLQLELIRINYSNIVSMGTAKIKTMQFR